MENDEECLQPQQNHHCGGKSNKSKNMLSIGGPDIDWVQLSTSLGVPAVEATTAEAFDKALAEAIAAPGPRLIAAVVPG